MQYVFQKALNLIIFTALNYVIVYSHPLGLFLGKWQLMPEVLT